MFFNCESFSQNNIYQVDGNVGIGISSPLYKLDVDGTAHSNAGFRIGSVGLGQLPNTSGFDFLTCNAYGTNPFVLCMINPTGVYGQAIDMWGGLNSHGLIGYAKDNPEHFIISANPITAAKPSIKFRTGGSWIDDNSTQMTIHGNGNIGIGTVAPTKKLHVVGESAFDGNLIIGDPQIAANNKNISIRFDKTNEQTIINSANWTAGYRSILINPDGTSENFGLGVGVTTVQARFHVKGASSTSGSTTLHAVNSSGTSLLFVRDDGNIGVGTTTPQAKFSVNGDVYSKKIKVTQTGWPDFVFSEKYTLMPLKELEKFIQAHNHLPGISSSKEVETEGLDVGGMQALQMQKIEELTLYIIELNKKIDELSKKVHEADNRTGRN